MKKNKQIRAFSLIELSIVILIIGILIAGVTQSSRLINEMRLSSARSQTQGSPVAGVRGLTLWIETTSTDSLLDAETVDQSVITVWNDINPQSSTKNGFIKYNNTACATSTRCPLYVTNAIGNLPAILFDGSNDLMENTATNIVPNITNAATVFMVIRPTADGDADPVEIVFSKRNTGATANIEVGYVRSTGATRGWAYYDGAGGYATGATTAIASNANYITTMVYDTTVTAPYVKFYQNGGAPSGNQTVTGVSTPNLTTNSKGTLGKNQDTGGYFSGYIGELIIYDRYLRNEERQAIEDYLGKKWSIKITRP